MRSLADRALPWAFAALGVVASLGIGACVATPADTDDLPACAMPSDSVSPELLAFLSKARASHLRADIAVDDERVEDAIIALERLVDGPRPAGAASPEIREVLADTFARTAGLRSGIGQYGPAKSDIERGLKLAVERTHYRGRLMEVLGAVEERHHADLTAQIALRREADADEAILRAMQEQSDEAKKRAIKASLDAIDIQEEVIQKALSDDLTVPAE